jgi:hypothetical protein
LIKGNQYKIWMIVKRKAAIAASIWDTCNLELPEAIIRKLMELKVPTPDNMIRKLIFMD